MKANAVSVESLKALGYRAKRRYISWNSNVEEDAAPKQSRELFKLVAEAARNGGKLTFWNDINTGCRCVAVPGTLHREWRGTTTSFYLARPMTDEEIRAEGWIRAEG